MSVNKIILVLIVANIIISIKGFKDESFFSKFKFQIGKIRSGEKIRMITSGFLHVDWIHLGFNMYALHLFGKEVTTNLGNTNFLLIYFMSLFAGSLYSLSQHKDNYYYSAVGASGAVSGVLFSAIMLFPEMKLMIIPIPVPIPSYIFGIGYLLYSIYGMKKQLGNIGHSAHLGGAIAGYIVTLWLQPNLINNNKIIIIIMGSVIAGILMFGKKLEKP